MQKFKERLKLLRRESNLSQQNFAKQIGISKSSVNMYERGEREPGLETLEAIADYFNVDMDFIMGKSEHRNKYQWLQTIDKPVNSKELLLETFDEKSVMDIVASKYGKNSCDILCLYVQLDLEDQGEIRGEMKQMLKAGKYKVKERLRNA